MIRIPGTKVFISPMGLLLTLVFIFALVTQDWSLIKVYGIIAGCYVLMTGLIMSLTARTRRPGESAWDCMHRSLGEVGSKEDHDTDHYVIANCGHLVQVYAPQTPAVGDVIWCPAHRRFGPAERATVTNPYGLSCKQRKKKIIVGAELD
jgi:hypothetical protein